MGKYSMSHQKGVLSWNGSVYCIGYLLGFLPVYRMGEILVVLCGLFCLATVYACSIMED